MRSSDLSRDQAERLRATVARRPRFPTLRGQRMNRLGFLPSGPLRRASQTARNTVRSLHVTAHCVACGRAMSQR
jgi:hypothetical protein